MRIGRGGPWNEGIGVSEAPRGTLIHHYKADRDGLVIGRTEAPLVNRGDALVHIAGGARGSDRIRRLLADVATVGAAVSWR